MHDRKSLAHVSVQAPNWSKAMNTGLFDCGAPVRQKQLLRPRGSGKDVCSEFPLSKRGNLLTKQKSNGASIGKCWWVLNLTGGVHAIRVVSCARIYSISSLPFFGVRFRVTRFVILTKSECLRGYVIFVTSNPKVSWTDVNWPNDIEWLIVTTPEPPGTTAVRRRYWKLRSGQLQQNQKLD